MRVATHADSAVRPLEELGLSPQDGNFPAMNLYEVMPPRPRARDDVYPGFQWVVQERLPRSMSTGVAGKAGKILEW